MMSTAPAPAPPSPADEWFTPGRFALLLALMIGAAFPEVVTGGGTFFHRDFALFGYPLAFFQRESFWHGELPLWTPLSYCGLPFLAQWNTMTLYPPALFYLLFPLSWSLGIFCLGHLFLAGLGMYFLAFRWTGNRFAAAMGGLAFVFTSLMLNYLMWPNYIATVAWMPWVVLTVERAWREGGRKVLFAALAGTLQMLAGGPEIFLLTWLFLTALLAIEFVQNRAERWRAVGRFVAVVLLVTGLSAAQLLPFLDLVMHSQRDKAVGDATWAMPLWGWANFLVPLFRARLTSLGVYSQPNQYWVYCYYLGIGAATLAMLGAWQGRQWRVRLLAILCVACLVMAVGDSGHVYAAVRRVIPILGFMRYPVKFIMLPAFLAPLLVAYFVAHCRSATDEQWARLRRKLVFTTIALIAVIGLIVLAAFQFPMQATSAIAAAQNGATRAVVLIALLGLLIALRSARENRPAMLARLGLVALVWLDVMTSGSRPNPSVPRWVYEPGLAARESGMNPLPRVGDGRPMLSAEAQGNVNVAQFTNATDTVVYSRLAMFANCNLLDHLPKVTGSYALYFRELGEVLEVLYGPPEPPPGLLDFLSVSQVNAPGKVTQWLPRPTHLPWVTGGQKPIFGDGPTTLRALGSKEFDPRREVYLPFAVHEAVTVTGESSPKVFAKEFAARRVRVEVEAGEPALLVISQSFSSNWRATVDGQPAALLRANHAFQAVEVSAGKHEVVLKYEDRMFRSGVVISGLVAAVCAAVSLRGRGRVRA
jgi:hypothetical protein